MMLMMASMTGFILQSSHETDGLYCETGWICSNGQKMPITGCPNDISPTCNDNKVPLTQAYQKGMDDFLAGFPRKTNYQSAAYQKD